jgi:hypothetical protein
MKEYEVSISADAFYTIKANSEEEAAEKALEYWDSYEPTVEVSEV